MHYLARSEIDQKSISRSEICLRKTQEKFSFFFNIRSEISNSSKIVHYLARSEIDQKSVWEKIKKFVHSSLSFYFQTHFYRLLSETERFQHLLLIKKRKKFHLLSFPIVSYFNWNFSVFWSIVSNKCWYFLPRSFSISFPMAYNWSAQRSPLILRHICSGQ